MNQLTARDCEGLLEALDAWDASGGRELLLDLMISPPKGPGGEIDRHAMESVMDKRKRADRARRERSILLKAKVILLRDSLAAGEAFDVAGEPAGMEAP